MLTPDRASTCQPVRRQGHPDEHMPLCLPRLFLKSEGISIFDDASKGYSFGFLFHHVCTLQRKVLVLHHLRLDGDTKLLLAPSHFLNCPSRVRLIGVPKLPGHADV